MVDGRWRRAVALLLGPAVAACVGLAGCGSAAGQPPAAAHPAAAAVRELGRQAYSFATRSLS